MTQPLEPLNDFAYEELAAGFIDALRNRRIELGMSQAAVARYMSTPTSTVAASTLGYWENGGNIPFYRFLQYAEIVRFEFTMTPYLTDVRMWVDESDEERRRNPAMVQAAARREATRDTPRKTRKKPSKRKGQR